MNIKEIILNNKENFKNYFEIKDNHIIEFICLCFFIAAMAKSAQVFFHVWLPDAMEGPTPASALIHAATMVAAGVFLIVRLSFLFELSPYVKLFILFSGSSTLLICSLIALFQNDIKKIIAYSTCSQLGYMFIGCGLGAYSFGLFHLITHAFFKSLLFLCAGSIIHQLNGEQNINKMGGLIKKLPFTYLFTLIGVLSLAGIYPFSGFFSKDAIIEAIAKTKSLTNDRNHTYILHYTYFISLFSVLLTSIYSFRMLFKVFHGETNIKQENFNKTNEAPLIILIPLSILSFISLFLGIIYQKLGLVWCENNKWFWSESIFHADIVNNGPISHLEMFISSSFGLLGALLVLLYNSNKLFKYIVNILINKISVITLIINNLFYFNYLYNFVSKQFLNIIKITTHVEFYIFDFLPRNIPILFFNFSIFIKEYHSGSIHSYVKFSALSSIIILIYVLLYI